jgi:8-oxo-dGTP diphosphatase
VKKNPTIIPVVAVALVDASGRVLMQQRRIGGEHGGLWEFPGGKVEPRESLEESLCREILEELGVTLSGDALEPLSFASDAAQPYVILFYTCREWEGEPQCLDGEAISWFTIEQIAALAMPPLDVPLARALKEHLARAK